MDIESIQLLDTPKRSSLELRSSQLRTALKDFERVFATEHEGRKPSKNDIKANVTLASQYKEYNKIRDVLAGKLGLNALDTTSSPKRKRHSRNDSGLGWTPRKTRLLDTPRKTIRANDVDPYDAPSSVSPNARLLSAIGPTPHRDGKVLGLLDLISPPRSGASAKHELLVTGHVDNTGGELQTEREDVTRTPGRRKQKQEGDILDYLTGTPQQEANTGHGKHSRTPASDGKKFMLSQLFETPSAARYSEMGNAMKSAMKTPLRDMVLGNSPQSKQNQPDLDATPGYLRRSVSFKDRLLSASQPVIEKEIKPSHSSRRGPPTLRHFRSAARTISQEVQSSQPCENDYDDEMAALREMESSEMNAFNGNGPSSEHRQSQADAESVGKPYKKKGQKRTTRRAMMRPTTTKAYEAPKFVAADNDNEASDDENVSETIVDDNGKREGTPLEDMSEDELQKLHEFDGKGGLGKKQNSSSKSKWDKLAKEALKEKSKPKTGAKKSGTINPNAYSHMNFRTLKIKNKNSKAKGAGRGRFGRGRR